VRERVRGFVKLEGGEKEFDRKILLLVQPGGGEKNGKGGRKIPPPPYTRTGGKREKPMGLRTLGRMKKENLRHEKEEGRRKIDLGKDLKQTTTETR